ncbi:endonuclease domain-containing protein [Streptomyces mirabilis]|uniref:endonuclease domain-containing protein n=1 Tax=Streptomyces mirabilis TaxID=68239 RepID=UPI00367AACA0
MLGMSKLCKSGDGKPATRMGGTRCQACYRYHQKHGTFERTGPRPPISIEVVLQNVEHAKSGCLVWKGMTDKDGRPLYYDGDRYAAGESPLVYVQRWMFEHYSDKPLSVGQTVTRNCENKLLCVHHEHAALWRHLGSGAFVNGNGDQDANDTIPSDRCANGHQFDDDNIPYVNPRTGARSCRRCTRDSKLRSRGIDPESVPYAPYRRGDTHCRSGHEYAMFGFKNRGEGRVCNECVRIKSAKGNLKKGYGLTFGDVARMLQDQDNACATCLYPFTEVDPDNFRMGDANVDHCHDRGHNRGLLCMDCNIALGKVKDNTDTLSRMIDYLKAQGMIHSINVGIGAENG